LYKRTIRKGNPIIYVKTAEVNNLSRILAVKPIGRVPLEDKEGYGRIMLKWILGR
jgi:hypothetical protein